MIPSLVRPTLHHEIVDVLIVSAGCLDKAIAQTARAEPLSESLAAIVEAVLRAGTAENGKLVRSPSTTPVIHQLTSTGNRTRPFPTTHRLDRDHLHAVQPALILVIFPSGPR